MKLEVLPDGSEDCPLVRVFDFVPAEVAQLFAAVSALASGEQQRLAVHDLPGVESIAGCRLLLRSGRTDRGLVQLATPAHFECVLTADTWDNVAGLVEPFLAECSGFQWLSTTGDANLLISKSGHW